LESLNRDRFKKNKWGLYLLTAVLTGFHELNNEVKADEAAETADQSHSLTPEAYLKAALATVDATGDVDDEGIVIPDSIRISFSDRDAVAQFMYLVFSCKEWEEFKLKQSDSPLFIFEMQTKYLLTQENAPIYWDHLLSELPGKTFDINALDSVLMEAVTLQAKSEDEMVNDLGVSLMIGMLAKGRLEISQKAFGFATAISLKNKGLALEKKDNSR
jgi:hypothetical protein